jgi:hypothetical protein
VSNLADPWKGAIVPVPANTDLRRIGTGIFVWVDGNLEFMTEEGDIIGPYAVTAGHVIPFRVKQIRSGTTAVITVGYSV